MRNALKNYGLIGWPVKHSVSPPMQNAGFKAANLNADYKLIEVSPDKMNEVIPEMKRNFNGWNCTVPHKQHIIEFLDEIDETAKILGSVNTVVNKNGKFKGYSTDGYGMEKSLEESFNLKIKGESFLFIGAGGAARAVALHFALNGAGKIAILNRTVEKAAALAKEINMINPEIITEVDNIEAKHLNINKYRTVIQSTSIGLHEGDPSPIAIENFNSKQYIVDMIYKDTEFLKQAKKLGCKTADGKGMLLHQGVKAWEIWTGQKAPVEEMRNALIRALS
jgi:shikimate dehydrogenase